VVVEVDVEVGGGVVIRVVTGMVAGDIVGGEEFVPYPNMVAGLGVGGGMVVLR